MKYPSFCGLIVSLGLFGLPLAQAGQQLHMVGVLGNSGEQGKSLVLFGQPRAQGMGVVYDSYGSLWDRAGDKVLNRYAVDGRQLATYKIPPSPQRNGADRLLQAGNLIVLFIDKKIYTLPVDAPSGTAITSLDIMADMISASSVDGEVAILVAKPDGTSSTISLLNPATKAVTPLITDIPDGINQIELLPGHDIMASVTGAMRGRKNTKIAGLQLYHDGKPATDGWPRTSPGDRMQLLGDYWYGGVWHGTIHRFNAELEAAPGVVLGGGSGAFIGHVDGNNELENPRGYAWVRPGLLAVSGQYGILHLLQWDEHLQQFVITRRIGAIPRCQGLGINRQGDVWFNAGYWKWSDTPGSCLHDCPHGGVEGPGIGQIAMLPSDNFAAPQIRGNHDIVVSGPFAWNIEYSDFQKGPTTQGGYLNGSAIYKQDKMTVLLAINAAGEGKSYRIDAKTGRESAELGPVTLATASPVKAWTSLAMKDENTLLGAADGFVIEMARDGANWKETRRWNTAPGQSVATFGSTIYITADDGNLWISDTDHQRVLCLKLADGSVVATCGTADQSGNDLTHFNGPRAIAARGSRAVVFDSANQRLIKLTL